MMVSQTMFPNETLQEQKLREYVNAAFERKAKGDRVNYDVMVKQLNTKDPSALRKWFHVLRQRVSVFSNAPNGNEYQELISAVLRFDNWENAELTEEFISLVSDLVSSNGCYVIPCFQVLVKNFLPRYKTNISNTSVEFDAQTSLAVGENTHRALKKLLTIVPSSPSALFSLLMEMFPHKRLDLTTQVTYVSNLLRIAAYCVVLRDRLLALIVEKIIQLDVEIKLEDVIEDEEEEEQLFNIEIEKNGSDVVDLNGNNNNNNHNNNHNNGVGGEALRNTLESKQLEISDMAEKLDSLMKLLFEYLRDLKVKEDNNEAGGGAENTNLDEVFNLFLRLFDCAILNTHKSKYTQFLLFFLCQFKMHYTKCFLGYLLNKLADSSNHALTRCTCAAYIGSFVSRSNNVTLPILKSCLFELSKWAHQYLDRHGDSGPDAQLHDIFYSVCQSICYIFCFKHKTLFENDSNREFCNNLNLERLIFSKLNPFKICLPSVIREFSKLSTRYEFLRCEDLIEKNKRLVLPTKTSYGGENQIDSFFPFDPYLLKNSSCFISEFYNTWKKLDEDDEEEEEDEEVEETAEEEQEEIEDEEEEGSQSSFMGTSIAEEQYEGAKAISRRFQDDYTEDLMSYTPDFSHEISLNDLLRFSQSRINVN